MADGVSGWMVMARGSAPRRGRWLFRAGVVGCVVLAGGAVAPDRETTWRVRDARPLVDSPPPFPLVESFLAVNPTDSSNLVASGMGVSSDESVVYASWDDGRSWRLMESPAGGPAFPGGDPMLAFDGNGRLYFTTITPRFNVWRSADGGRSWEGPVEIAGHPSFDRQWLAARQAPGTRPVPLHAAAKVLQVVDGRERDVIVTSTSRDGGRSFATPTLMPVDSGYLNTVTDLEVRRDGTVLMPFLVHYGYAPEGGLLRGKRWLLTSEDEGRSWSGPFLMGTTATHGGAGDWELMLKSLAPGSIVADETGGAFRGSLYTTWPTTIDGRLQIVAAFSRDDGRTWSDPVPVNQGGRGSNHSTPMMAVDQRGVVAVVWNDRRDDPDDACFRPYIAVSVDGGESFAPDLRISDQATCPARGSRWMNGGETLGLVPRPGGGFRVVWTVGGSRDLHLWTAVVEPSGD